MKQEIRERIEKIRKGEVPEGYRKTKVGIAVKEWDLIELRTVFEEVSELTSDIQKYPLSSLTIQTGVEAKTQRYERSFLITKEGDNYKIVSKDQFVFNPMNIRFGAIGRYKGETKVCVSGYYNVFRCINGNNPAYMEYLLKDYRMIQLYNKYALGSLIEKQRLHYSHFIKFKISLPQVKEQQKIADILFTWDKAIELKEKLIIEKKEFKRGLMQKLLTGEMRFPGFTDEWEVKKLGELVDKFVNGGTPSTKVSDYWNGEIPWITGADILNQKVAVIRRYISIEAVKNSSTNIIEKNNLLLVSRTGVGKLAITPFDVAISQDFTGIYTKKSELDTDYLFIYLDFAQKELTKQNQGTSIQGITRETLASIPIPLPPNDEQHKIVEIIRLIDNNIELLKSELAQLKEQKRGLKQLLLTGIVRVEVD